MIYKMELSDSVDTMVFELLEVPIVDKDITGIAENTTIDGNVFDDYLWLKKQYVQKWSIMCQDEYDRLRGFWTRQFGNAEVPFYRLFYGSNIYEDKNFLTSDGFTQILNPTENLAPLSLTHLYGNATQSGEPTPDSPIPVNVVSGAQTVKITGKNILQTITGSATQSGVSLTSTNGNITASGTATANITFTLTGTDGITYRQAYWQTITASATNSVLLQKGTYYLGATATLGNISAQFRLADLGQKLEDGTSISLNSSFTITEPKRLCITIYVNNNNTPNVSISDLQLELGTQRSNYEPYQAQSQEINLGGSNVFDVSSATMANIYMNTNGWASASNDWIGTDSFIEVKPNTTYTLSSSASANTQVAINQYTAQNRSNFISPRINTATFTTDATAKYISFSIKDPNATNFMLNEGATVLPYVPYTTYAYELAKIGTYQDYIWNDNGTWKVHKEVGKVVLDGTESTWAYTSGQHARFQYSNNTIALEPSPSAVGAVVSDHFTASSTNDIYSGIDGKIGVHATVHQFWLSYLAITDLNDFKTWLGTHPTTVYYALATPTDTEITDSELIEQLNHIYELYQGTNNLWLIPSAGAQGEIEGTYRLIYEEETDIVSKTPVVLTLTDGGVINPCGCRQNIQLIMRETEGN